MKILRIAPVVASVIGLSLVSIAPSVYATTEDTSLLSQTQSANAPNFAPKKFTSCTDMKVQIADFMELYYEKNPPYSYRGGIYPTMVEDAISAVPEASAVSGAGASKTAESTSDAANTDFSTTNTRTIGVDEPDTVKTDGKYLYSARIEDKAIYIHTADDSLTLVTKIVLPEEFTSAEVLLDGNRLVLVAQKYVYKTEFASAWIDRTQKTVVAVYDITNKSKPLLERYSQIDGYLKDARLVSGKLTLVSSTTFNFPYDRYFPQVSGTSLELDMKKLSGDFSTKNVLPKRIDFAVGKKSADIAVEIKRAQQTKKLQEVDASTCAQTSYILPDEATLDSYNFSPTFTAITQINVRNPNIKPTTNLLFGDVSKTYLAASGNLYLTSQMYTGYSSSCPVGARCIMRWMEPSTKTLIHKYSTLSSRAEYKQTGLVDGSLITDYAIDEKANQEVRLVTQKTGEQRESMVTVLDSTLKQIGSLAGLGKTENFQSARFIGDRLYLVTFKQIDPLFVIDVQDGKNPKVLGELKIPGYSTYLHPYDQDRLIGIGYDTATNEWGGTQNAGLKIDLYNVSDVAHPKQEGTLTLGDAGSYSDALNNPRLFVWRKSKNTLYLPATITKSISADRPYDYKEYFQGMVAVKIDSNASKIIQEVGRNSHITWDDTDLQKQLEKECAQYKPKTEKVCRRLISGEEVCTDPVYTYVPNYCYADGGLSSYKASKIWEKSAYFIDRVMYSQNRVFTLSRGKIESLSDFDFSIKGKTDLPIRTNSDYPVRVY